MSATSHVGRRAAGIFAGALLLGFVSLLDPPAAHAVTFTVNSTADEVDANLADGLCQTAAGTCTLRAALQQSATGDTVNLPAGLYVLTIPAGTEGVTVPVDPAQGDLDISVDVTIVGAGADRTVIDGNGDHRVLDIHAGGAAHVSMVGLRNGKADVDGATGHRHGGVIHNHGTLELTESTVSGGLVDTDFWGGGGIINAGNGTMTLRNVTVSGNQVAGANGFGGGIENFGAATINYTTISQNAVATAANGAGLAARTGSATVGNTILAGNTGNNCFVDPSNPITSAGYNIQDTGSCPFLNTGDTVGNPMLSPVNNVYASIFVYALQTGSPALDTASPLSCPGTDERGVTRPQEGDGASPAFCDKGAFELAPPPPPPPTVRCDERPATIVGTSAAETIVGTAGADVIAARGGNDTVRGLGGADRICGGGGRDRVEGGGGNDRLFGNDGADSLFGNAGNDVLFGGDGDDRLDGGANTDRCVSGGGTDTRVSCES